MGNQQSKKPSKLHSYLQTFDNPALDNKFEKFRQNDDATTPQLNNMAGVVLKAIQYYDNKFRGINESTKGLNESIIESFLSQHNVSNYDDLLKLTINDLDELNILGPPQRQIVNYFKLLVESKQSLVQKLSNYHCNEQLLNVIIKNAVFDANNGVITLNKSDIVASDESEEQIKIQINPQTIFINNNEDKKILYNPLIVLLGISEFKSEPLVGIKYDMMALKNLFEKELGFKTIHENYRMHWTEIGIKLFWERVLNEMIDFPNNKLWGIHDGIFFILSSHGGDNCIYDSNEKEYNLYDLYKIFGDDNPLLLTIPRLWFIDACRGSDSDGFVNIRSKDKKQPMDDEKDAKEKESQNVKVHKGKNRVTLFGQSPGIQSGLDCNIEELEKHGSSWFIRCIIKRFRDYLSLINIQKDFLVTPNLSNIMSDIGKDLEVISKMRQIPYKNGDASVDHLKLFIKINKKYKYASDDFPTWAADDIVVRLHAAGDEVIDVSALSTRELEHQIGVEDIEQLPVIRAKIIGVEQSKQLQSTTVYHVQTVHGSKHSIQLRSIAGIELGAFRKVTYGTQYFASKHRFVRLNITNRSKIYSLRLLTKERKLYFDNCKFLISPKIVNVPCWNEGPANLQFYIVGQQPKSTTSDNDFFYLNRIYETGVCGILQFVIKKNDERIGKVLIVAFRNSNPKKPEQDLQNPWFDCWIVNGKGFNTKDLKRIVAKLKDNKTKRKDKLYEFDEIFTENETNSNDAAPAKFVKPSSVPSNYTNQGTIGYEIKQLAGGLCLQCSIFTMFEKQILQKI